MPKFYPGDKVKVISSSSLYKDQVFTISYECKECAVKGGSRCGFWYVKETVGTSFHEKHLTLAEPLDSKQSRDWL